MKRKDVRVGMTVYHGVFTHWGPGVVQCVDSVDLLESLFDRGKIRLVVDFEGCDGTVRLRPSEVRKTPNRKKILAMVELYRKCGKLARDGGDRLMFPELDDEELT